MAVSAQRVHSQQTQHFEGFESQGYSQLSATPVLVELFEQLVVPQPMHKNFVTPETPDHPFVFPPSFQGHLTLYSTNLVGIFLPLHANISNETTQQDPFPLDCFGDSANPFGESKYLTLAAHPRPLPAKLHVVGADSNMDSQHSNGLHPFCWFRGLSVPPM